jgi:hypothetical protein
MEYSSDYRAAERIKYFFICKVKPANSFLYCLSLKFAIRIISILGILWFLTSCFLFINSNFNFASFIFYILALIDLCSIINILLSASQLNFDKAYLGYFLYVVVTMLNWIYFIVLFIIIFVHLNDDKDILKTALIIFGVEFCIYFVIRPLIIYILYSWTKNLGMKNGEAISDFKEDLVSHNNNNQRPEVGLLV